jgi:hypothetical protein
LITPSRRPAKCRRISAAIANPQTILAACARLEELDKSFASIVHQELLSMLPGFMIYASASGQLLLSLLVSLLPVRLSTSSGESVDGKLSSIQNEAVMIQTESGSNRYAFDELLSLMPQEQSSKTGPTPRVTLVNGSRIAAEDYRLEREMLTLQLRRQTDLEIPLKEVKAIRFRRGSSVTDPAWQGLFEKQLRGDLLVIRREEDRLDPTEGLVESIRSGEVGFNLDGELLQAPIDRLEGVVFGGPPLGESNANIEVTDVYGSIWQVDAIETDAESNALVLSISGLPSHSLPLSQIESIRWSGAMVMLAAESIAESSYTPFFQSTIDNTQSWFGPRGVGDADVVLTGDSFVEYRVDGGYRLFSGGVRRDESVRQAGLVIVRVKLDGEVVWDQKVTDTETFRFQLPLGDARRVRLEVDTADDGPVGDIVRFVRPRLLK